MNGGMENEVSIGERARAGVTDSNLEMRRPPLAVSCSENGPSGKRQGMAWWSRLFATDTARQALALLDQAVVSGTSFVTTIVIGRWCGASELGVYALGFSLLVSWGCVHQSLITLPYTIYRHRTRWGTEEEYAGSALLHNGLLSAVAILALAVGAVCLSVGGTLPGLTAVLWTLAGVMPFALLREFSRRFAFAHLHMSQALVLDLAVAAVQLLGLAWLASTGALSATTAYAAFGAGCALSGALWLFLDRASFVIRWKNLWPTLQQSWSLGKWLFASQATVWVQAYFIHWLLACVVGPTATGVYAACMTVVMFSNPLILGISNALAPRAAQAFVEGGGAKLRRVIFGTTLLLGTAMALFCVVVLFAGEEIMGLLYQGSQYGGHGNTVAVLALAMLATALGMPASNGLAAAERPDLTFKAALLAVVLSMILVPCLVLKWGMGGAAYGFLVGTVAGSLGRWVGFLAILRWHMGKRGPSIGRFGPGEWGEPAMANGSEAAPVKGEGDASLASLIRVLQQFTQTTESTGWVMEPMNEGAQARIFAVWRRDGQPLAQLHQKLAVKLYRAAGKEDSELLRRQFDSLTQFHAELNGSTINGWKIHVPAPLYLCDRPRALVMTLVPGRSLNSILETSDPATIDTLESLAQTVIAAMERCWSIDAQLHGDFNFDNILCDLDVRTLSFVDSGVVKDVLLCEGVRRRWYPASRDLAHLLFETTVSVKKSIGHPAARRRQQSLLELVLQAFLKPIGSTSEKNSVLDEIQACARIQLERLQASWSPRGMWRLYLRRMAFRRMDRILGRLRAETAVAREGPLSAANNHAQRIGAWGRNSRDRAMRSTPAPSLAKPPAVVSDEVEQKRGLGRILLGVFEILDRAGIPYCVLHGYEGYPERIKSDVDCMISSEVRPGQLAALLHQNRIRLGAEIVHFRHYRGFFIVLAGKNVDGSPCSLQLDLRWNYELGDLQFLTGREVLLSRRRHNQFWVPAANLEFGCYLVRKIVKGTLDDEQGPRLSKLYQQDPAGCRQQIARFWGTRSTALLVAAASSGDWEPVRRILGQLGTEVRRRAFWRRPLPVLGTWLGRVAGRAKRCWRPDSGLDVIFLGPDGAGKSSVIRSLRRQLMGAFAKTACYSFPPALLRRLHQPSTNPEKLPHAAPPRSFLASVSRAVLYWFVYYTLGYYGTVHLALASSTLVLHDRHLVDALVDPRRYRYAGPSWLLRLIWQLIPKPDLVILLDAPPEVLQARKQEVPFEETTRQREAYRGLVRTMRNGYVVAVDRPLPEVVDEVHTLILQHLTARIARRLGVEQSA